MPKGSLEMLIFILKEFTPIEPFYTNYLLESKKFTTIELSNKAAPIFFVMSFATILFTLSLIEALDFSGSLLFVCIVQFCLFSILLIMKERDFLLVKLFYGLNGAVSTFDAILRNLIISESSNKDSIDTSIAGHKVCRAIASSLACWVGQDIYYKTHHHEINIFVSMTSLFPCIVISIFSIITESGLKTESKISFFEGLDIAVKHTGFRTWIAIYSSVFAGCIYVFSSLFSHNIFNEKNMKNYKAHPIRNLRPILNILKIPIGYLSEGIIRVAKMFNSKYINSDKPRWSVASGNIEGFIGIFCPLMVYFITKTVSADHKELGYGLSLISASLFVYFLTVSKIPPILYLLHMATLIAASSSDCMAKGLIQSNSWRASLLIFGSISESLIHITINFMCERMIFSVATKGRIYGAAGMFYSIFSLITQLNKI